MINPYISIMITGVFIASVSQIILKKSADMEHKSSRDEILNPYVITAYSLFLLSTLLAIVALKGLALKIAPILTSMSYIFIFLMSRFILKENINRNKIYGLIIIITGIIIFNI